MRQQPKDRLLWRSSQLNQAEMKVIQLPGEGAAPPLPFPGAQKSSLYHLLAPRRALLPATWWALSMPIPHGQRLLGPSFLLPLQPAASKTPSLSTWLFLTMRYNQFGCILSTVLSRSCMQQSQLNTGWALISQAQGSGWSLAAHPVPGFLYALPFALS